MRGHGMSSLSPWLMKKMAYITSSQPNRVLERWGTTAQWFSASFPCQMIASVVQYYQNAAGNMYLCLCRCWKWVQQNKDGTLFIIQHILNPLFTNLPLHQTFIQDVKLTCYWDSHLYSCHTWNSMCAFEHCMHMLHVHFINSAVGIPLQDVSSRSAWQHMELDPI
jgi:hypothetical protein